MKKSVAAIPVAVMALAVMGITGCGTNTSSSSNSSNQAKTTNTSQQSAFPVTLKDDAGHTVTVSKRPEHIASTTEGTDEILSALVPKKDIALVTTYASDPTYSNITSFVKGIPAIQQANAEQILAAKPDLVLTASYTKQGVVNQIEQAHVPVYEFNDFKSISDIERNIEVVGKLVGNEAGAKNVVHSMEEKLQAVEKAVKDDKKPKVLDYSSFGFAAGSSTTVNDVIVDAGGINAAAQLQGWQKITDEEIVKLNPDVFIVTDDDKAFIQKILSDPKLKTVSAVKNHRVYSVKGADLMSVSQYITRGVQDVAKVLHPTAQIRQ
jgi:iron complex transport system substrate-binding protein